MARKSRYGGQKGRSRSLLPDRNERSARNQRVLGGNQRSVHPHQPYAHWPPSYGQWPPQVVNHSYPQHPHASQQNAYWPSPYAPWPASSVHQLHSQQSYAYQQNAYHQNAYQQLPYQQPAHQQPAHQKSANQQPALQQSAHRPHAPQSYANWPYLSAHWQFIYDPYAHHPVYGPHAHQPRAYSEHTRSTLDSNQPSGHVDNQSSDNNTRAAINPIGATNWWSDAPAPTVQQNTFTITQLPIRTKNPQPPVKQLPIRTKNPQLTEEELANARALVDGDLQNTVQQDIKPKKEPTPPRAIKKETTEAAYKVTKRSAHDRKQWNRKRANMWSTRMHSLKGMIKQEESHTTLSTDSAAAPAGAGIMSPKTDSGSASMEISEDEGEPDARPESDLMHFSEDGEGEHQQMDGAERPKTPESVSDLMKFSEDGEGEHQQKDGAERPKTPESVSDFMGFSEDGEGEHQQKDGAERPKTPESVSDFMGFSEDEDEEGGGVQLEGDRDGAGREMDSLVAPMSAMNVGDGGK
ncbi:MAG: hypothetical protein M1831_000616 [Alyxoria varia]|nr:MAG: hypothetical protein M1831_000616 [Alyxoria varia]